MEPNYIGKSEEIPHQTKLARDRLARAITRVDLTQDISSEKAISKLQN